MQFRSTRSFSVLLLVNDCVDVSPAVNNSDSDSNADSDLRKLMRLWYLSQRRPAKTRASTVSPIYGLAKAFPIRTHEVWVRPKNQNSSPHWMAAHAHLKNEFTENKKDHNLMRCLI